MSFASIEREILAEARIVSNKPKLRKKDILEWSTGNVNADTQIGEVTLYLPELQINVVIQNV